MRELRVKELMRLPLGKKQEKQINRIMPSQLELKQVEVIKVILRLRLVGTRVVQDKA
jgi:hypothetical protein